MLRVERRGLNTRVADVIPQGVHLASLMNAPTGHLPRSVNVEEATWLGGLKKAEVGLTKTSRATSAANIVLEMRPRLLGRDVGTRI
jgi:hypothetical protein